MHSFLLLYFIRNATHEIIYHNFLLSRQYEIWGKEKFTKDFLSWKKREGERQERFKKFFQTKKKEKYKRNYSVWRKQVEENLKIPLRLKVEVEEERKTRRRIRSFFLSFRNDFYGPEFEGNEERNEMFLFAKEKRENYEIGRKEI